MVEDATITKVVALLCATFITAFAVHNGHNGNLALYAVIGLFGGEKILGRLIKNDS